MNESTVPSWYYVVFVFAFTPLAWMLGAALGRAFVRWYYRPRGFPSGPSVTVEMPYSGARALAEKAGASCVAEVVAWALAFYELVVNESEKESYVEVAIGHRDDTGVVTYTHVPLTPRIR